MCFTFLTARFAQTAIVIPSFTVKGKLL
jgi:hypothetical protein